MHIGYLTEKFCTRCFAPPTSKPMSFSECRRGPHHPRRCIDTEREEGFPWNTKTFMCRLAVLHPSHETFPKRSVADRHKDRITTGSTTNIKHHVVITKLVHKSNQGVGYMLMLRILRILKGRLLVHDTIVRQELYRINIVAEHIADAIKHRLNLSWRSTDTAQKRIIDIGE